METSLTFEPKFAVTTLQGLPIASYCRFRQGKWHSTRCFNIPNGGQLSVDVDEHNVPLGLQWINVVGTNRLQESVFTQSPDHRSLMSLFDLAKQLAQTR